MEYIVKITLVKEKIQGYLSIYIGKSHLGQKRKRKEILYIITIYIGKTIQISLYSNNKIYIRKIQSLLPAIKEKKRKERYSYI